MRGSLFRPEAGFSLVEVVVAIGIVGFCLIAIVGLFSTGQLAGRRATDDTTLAAATMQVLSKLRSQSAFALPATNYFDLHGQEVTNTLATYVCEINSAITPATELSGISTNLARVKIQFTWPASLPPGQRPNTNVFHAALSQP